MKKIILLHILLAINRIKLIYYQLKILLILKLSTIERRWLNIGIAFLFFTLACTVSYFDKMQQYRIESKIKANDVELVNPKKDEKPNNEIKSDISIPEIKKPSKYKTDVPQEIPEVPKDGVETFRLKKMTKSDRPYGNRDWGIYIKYWIADNLGFLGAIKGNSQGRMLPIEVIAAKCWFETNGGLTGVAGKDHTAMFGIKGKNGVIGFDDKEEQFVQYGSYGSCTEGIIAFNNLLCGIYKENKYTTLSAKIYQSRFLEWRSKNADDLRWLGVKNEFINEVPDYVHWLLAMQVAPSWKLEHLRPAYASMGWVRKDIKRIEYLKKKYEKTGNVKYKKAYITSLKKMHKERIAHAINCINFLERLPVMEAFNKHYIKYKKIYDTKGIKIKKFYKRNGTYIYSVQKRYDFE